jgi:TonB family protein
LIDAQRRVIRGTLAATGVAEPTGVVVVTMDRNGGAPAVSAFDTNFPLAALDPAAPELVVQARRTLPEEETFDRLAWVVRIDTVPLPAARADGRRLVCGPVAVNRAELLRALNDWIEANPDRGLRAREATVGLLLTRDGRVAYSEMAISTGDAAFDSVALATADRLTFRGPRTIDGVSYDLWVLLPIAVAGMR